MLTLNHTLPLYPYFVDFLIANERSMRTEFAIKKHRRRRFHHSSFLTPHSSLKTPFLKRPTYQISYYFLKTIKKSVDILTICAIINSIKIDRRNDIRRKKEKEQKKIKTDSKSNKNNSPTNFRQARCTLLAGGSCPARLVFPNRHFLFSKLQIQNPILRRSCL